MAAADTDLNSKLVPIGSLKPYKGNARIGDVKVIRESLRINKQYRPVVVRVATGEILAGNHTWKAAKEEKWTEIWATFIDCDEETAKRINLVDNKAAEFGSYDEDALLGLLGSLPTLEGTGWTGQELEGLMGKTSSQEELAAGLAPEDVPDDSYEGQLGVIVMCTNQKQQQFVYEQLQQMVNSGSTEYEGTELKVVAI